MGRLGWAVLALCVACGGQEAEEQPPAALDESPVFPAPRNIACDVWLGDAVPPKGERLPAPTRVHVGPYCVRNFNTATRLACEEHAQGQRCLAVCGHGGENC